MSHLSVKKKTESNYYTYALATNFYPVISPTFEIIKLHIAQSYWEEGLPRFLLAAREVVRETTGVSLSDLCFGHAA